jgi:hypothetical protein
MEETSPHGAHERSDISVRAVGKYGLWILLGAIVSLGLMWLLYGGLEAREERREVPPPPMTKANPRTQPPEPRLESDPVQSLAEYRAAEQSRITTYGWVDAEKGIVRLPIDRAMELVAKEGLPSREAAKK